ncbi:MAG: SRPBCC family protein [Leptospiraceae bacterium]|nr:SRPBCC family protein [Leptospiraceae bacterium]
MKAFLKWTGVTIGSLIILFALVGLFLPAEYSASRSIEIQQPVDRVFPLVNSLEEQQKWSPWREADPDMQIEWSEKVAGEGATYSWKGPISGEGSMTIVRSVENQALDTALEFKDQGQAMATWKFEPMGDNAVKVTWGFSGDAGWNLMGRYFGLFMDSFIGPDFERGLANLKKLAETGEATNQI